MPTVITRGAASAQGYGFAARSAAANYIEDVFLTYLYTGTGSAQTITNGIDISGKGALTWLKVRNTTGSNYLYDTVRGLSSRISSDTTAAAASAAENITAFNSDGFTLGTSSLVNTNGNTYTSWTFRKQAKFFDVVTFTSNASRGATFNHNLGSSPGCVIIKCTSATENWWVWHRTFSSTQYMSLNTTDARVTGTKAITVSSTQVTLEDLWLNNANATYVAYLFAHDAGGFGAAGTDNVISCGSYTGNGSATGPTVTLGYEPQWLLIKRALGGTGDWNLIDNMRGFVVGGTDAELNPNLSAAETTGTFVTPTATGFQINTTDSGYNASGSTYIYIAIRRGPMKTPTSGTSVYENVAYTGNATTQRQIGSSVLMDMALISNRTAGATDWTSYAHYVFDRLRGDDKSLATTRAVAESSSWADYFDSDKNAGWDTGLNTQAYLNGSGQTYVSHILKRAPGFFDVVCYTGTGANRTVSHNLGVAPELMIVKGRSGATAWQVYSSSLANTEYLVLDTTAAKATGATRWNSTTPTASVFSLGTASEVNTSTATYVAYLFATVAGVSKVGSYTGTGTTKQIDCGFTGGARFVLIKRTDSTGDWYVWDSARGIVAGNDPYLLLNSTAAEVTSTDYVDAYSAGFEISSTAPAAINANGGSFIFLAIA